MYTYSIENITLRLHLESIIIICMCNIKDLIEKCLCGHCLADERCKEFSFLINLMA